MFSNSKYFEPLTVNEFENFISKYFEHMLDESEEDKTDNVKQSVFKPSAVKTDSSKQSNVKTDDVKQSNVKTDDSKQSVFKQLDVKTDDTKQSNAKQSVFKPVANDDTQTKESKQIKINKLNEQKTIKTQEIAVKLNEIAVLEKEIKEIENELIELNKKNPLEDFEKHVHQNEIDYEVDLNKIYNKFVEIFESLNKNNVQLNIDNVNNKFTLMVEGAEFTDSQKLQIKKLKALFKTLNM